MKKLIVYLLLVFVQYNISAQTTENLWDNGSSGFNCPGCCSNVGQSPSWNCWEIDSTNLDNIWQSPKNGSIIYKPFLGYAGHITDTINPYPVNNSSSFEFMVTDWPYVTDCFGMFLIIFNHIFDTDTMYDGGYLEISFDNKETWYNIIDSVPQFILDSTADYSLENMYGNSDTLWNGQKGFSGRKELFTSVVIFTLKPQYNCSIDTIFIRFTFISDSIDNHKEGWNIYSISLTVEKGFPMKINANFLNKIQIPETLIRCTDNYFSNSLPDNLFANLIDITGKTILSRKITDNNFWVDCNITPGIYALSIYNNEFIKTTKVLIK